MLPCVERDYIVPSMVHGHLNIETGANGVSEGRRISIPASVTLFLVSLMSHGQRTVSETTAESMAIKATHSLDN